MLIRVTFAIDKTLDHLRRCVSPEVSPEAVHRFLSSSSQKRPGIENSFEYLECPVSELHFSGNGIFKFRDTSRLILRLSNWWNVQVGLNE